MWQFKFGALLVYSLIAIADTTENGSAIGSDLSNITADAFSDASEELQTELQDQHWQWLVVSVATVIGLVALIDGAELFKWVLMSIWFVICYTLAMGQLHAHWHIPIHHQPTIHSNLLWMMIAASEIAFLAVCIAVVSWEGVKIALGFCSGWWFAHALLAMLQSVGSNQHGFTKFLQNEWFNVAIYSVCVILGIWIFKFSTMMFRGGKYVGVEGQKNVWELSKKGPGWLLSLVAAGFGGRVISSVSCWGIMKIAMACCQENDKLHLPREMPKWIEFWQATAIPPNVDVGIFANSDFNNFKWDYVIGYSLWAIFFVLGAWNQRRIRKKREAEEAAKKASRQQVQGMSAGRFQVFEQFRGKTEDNMSSPLVQNQL